MKKLIILLFICILLPIVTAGTSFIFQKETNADIKIECLDLNNSFCEESTACQITIYYPNQSIMISNESMSHNAVYFNYTLDSSQIKAIGEYGVFTSCQGDENGFSTFNFLVTASGQEKINFGEGLSLFGSLIVIIIIAIFFFTISFLFQNYAVKLVFIGLASMILVISVLFALVTVMQNLGGYQSFVEGYTSFWLIIKILVYVFLIALLMFSIIIVGKFWQIKRGFKD